MRILMTPKYFPQGCLFAGMMSLCLLLAARTGLAQDKVPMWDLNAFTNAPKWTPLDRPTAPGVKAIFYPGRAVSRQGDTGVCVAGHSEIGARRKSARHGADSRRPRHGVR